MSPQDAVSAPVILIHTFFNYGHYLVYAENITQWALAKGFTTALMGVSLAGTDFTRRHGDNPRVQIIETSPGAAMDQKAAEWARPGLVAEAARSIPEMQRRLAPLATFLLTMDDFLLEGVPLPSFAARTIGIDTFGGRKHFTGYADKHASRLKALLADCSPLDAILTLDEYHAHRSDPEERRLIFLPDMFALPSGMADDASPEEIASLTAFLDAAPGPVIPILGKLDKRKNAPLVLRTIKNIPDASCVVIGERVPGPEDSAIDILLDGLTQAGRAFIRQGFVPEGLFRMILSHPAVPFLPLPYICHYGSSGPQLMGLAHGKPSLVPDNGLMGRRVAEHGLGASYPAGDDDAFARAFRRLLDTGPGPFREAAARFMVFFSRQNLHAQLDRAAGLTPGGPSPLAGLVHAGRDAGQKGRPLHAGLDLLLEGRAREAVECFDEALDRTPESGSILFRKALAHDALGETAQRDAALREALARGAGEELDHYVRSLADACLGPGGVDPSSAAFAAMTGALALAAGGSEDSSGSDGQRLSRLVGRGSFSQALQAATWQRVGAVLAQAGEHDAAVVSFERAIGLDPRERAYLLNLSDVLRYAKRFQESEAALDRLEALDPSHAGLSHKRGQILYDMGRPVEALKHFLQEPESSAHRTAAMEYAGRIRASGL